MPMLVGVKVAGLSIYYKCEQPQSDPLCCCPILEEYRGSIDLAHSSHGFNRVPTSSENHGKPGKSLKKVPCMEKSWHLKKKLNNHGKIVDFG